MRQSRFTAEQIIAILAEQERGMRTAEVCRNHGISPNTFYKWKAKYGGLDISDARKLKSLETENGRLIPPSGMPDSRWGFPSGPISDSMW